MILFLEKLEFYLEILFFLSDLRIVKPACFLVSFTWKHLLFLSFYSKIVSILKGEVFHVNNKNVDPVF